jgi:hypothetical protein
MHWLQIPGHGTHAFETAEPEAGKSFCEQFEVTGKLTVRKLNPPEDGLQLTPEGPAVRFQDPLAKRHSECQMKASAHRKSG